LLLLDEPTNHLDIPSQEILQAVLGDFPGTILLVSHDRYLIDALATQIWTVEAGALEVFKGSWSEYVKHRAREKEREKAGASGPNGSAARGAKAGVGQRATPAAPRGQAQPAERRQKASERKHAARLAKVEGEIAALEQRLGALTREMEDAGADVDRVRALGEEYAEVQAGLAARLGEWEALAA
jgi:ATP-binding cassette subfamily F protein 3